MKYRIKQKSSQGYYVEIKDSWFWWNRLVRYIPYPVTIYFKTIEEAELAAKHYKITEEDKKTIVKSGEI